MQSEVKEGAPRDDRVGPGLVGALVVLNLWNLLGGPGPTYLAMLAVAGVFVWRERATIPVGIVRIATGIGLVALVAWPLGAAGLHSLERGVGIGAMISSVMATVLLLARAAARSPGIQTLTAYVQVQPYRRRYGLLAATGQVLPCLLGFAGMHMMLGVAGRGQHGSERQRLALYSVACRSFGAATLWTPTSGNVVILLSLYPQLEWAQILPVGLGLALLTVMASFAVDARLLLSAPAAREGDTAPAGVLRAAGMVLLAMVVFFAVIMGASRAFAVPVAGSVALLAPLVALGLHYRLMGPGRSPRGAVRRFLGDATHLRALAPEMLLFLAAAGGGTVIADSIPPAWIAAAAGLTGGIDLLAILLLMLSIVALSCIGLHAVLSAVLLGSTLTPQILGLPPLVHMCALLVGWSLSGIVAPFSMLNMTASRYADVSIYRMGLRQNWRFALIMLVMATVVLMMLGR